MPWFTNPSTVCWLYGTQYVTGTKLRNHWEHNHQGVDISTNWGPHRFDVYFQKMESFVLSAAAIRGITSLFDVYYELSRSKAFTCMKKPRVMCPGHDMFKAFLTRHGQAPVSEYIISPSSNSMACLLHWRVLLQLLVPLSLEQARQLLADKVRCQCRLCSGGSLRRCARLRKDSGKAGLSSAGGDAPCRNC